jgi:hypothetical protein
LLNNMAPPPIPVTASPLNGIVTEPLKSAFRCFH